MKRYVMVPVLFMLVVGALPGQAQQASNQRLPVRVSVSAYYQHYTDEGRRLKEVSFPLSIYLPIGRQFGLSMQTSQARASAEDLEELQGIDDVYLTLNHARKIGAHRLVFSLGANLPSGKSELTRDEFQTSVVLSRNFFPFHVPSFGQGFNVVPGVTWAVPLNDDLIVGAGVVVRFRGSYRPLEDMEERFAPGNEILLAGGLEYRLNPTRTLSVDLTHTVYQDDKIGSEDVFALGSQTTLRLQGRAYFDFDVLRLVVHYLKQGKSRILSEQGFSARQTVPNQNHVLASFRKRFSRGFHATVLGQARFFGRTEGSRSLLGADLSTTSKMMVDFGLLPEVQLTRSVRMIGRFLFTVGDITGVEAGLGLTMTL